jgi:hypothetical protein
VRKLKHASLRALRALDICPLVPIDVVVPLIGAGSRVSAYQLLSRLQRSGLVEARRVHLGLLLGDRACNLWSITESGRNALRAAGTAPAIDNAAAQELLPLGPPDGSRCQPGSRALPLRVASARVLAAMIVMQSRVGRVLELRAWEAPWARSIGRPTQHTISLPGAAVVALRDVGASGDSALSLVIVPDLGTSPVVRFGSAVRLWLKTRVDNDFAKTTEGQTRHLLVIATPDHDRRGTRAMAWSRLTDQIQFGIGNPRLEAVVLSWVQVATLLGEAAPAVAPIHTKAQGFQHVPDTMSRADSVLALIGRHPFITLDQLAAATSVTRQQARRLRARLIARGWVRVMPSSTIGSEIRALMDGTLINRDVAELTPAGRRQLASWFGLPSAALALYHGVFGNGGTGTSARSRLGHNLAHTMGTNDVFAALAQAAHSLNALGGNHALEDWRPAAACERRLCKPDGYGLYRRNGDFYGFFVEYDRGTESARQYRCKFTAYYQYRNSRHAARDYTGFPTLLFVTTDGRAERRIARQATIASLAQNGNELHILITTTERIAGNQQGILGSIWIRPGEEDMENGRPRHYWLRDDRPADLAAANAPIEEHQQDGPVTQRIGELARDEVDHASNIGGASDARTGASVAHAQPLRHGPNAAGQKPGGQSPTTWPTLSS